MLIDLSCRAVDNVCFWSGYVDVVPKIVSNVHGMGLETQALPCERASPPKTTHGCNKLKTVHNQTWYKSDVAVPLDKDSLLCCTHG